MGVFELFFYIVVIALVGALAVWVLGRLAPTHPPLVDNIIWVVVVILIVAALWVAFGSGHDPRVPRLR